MGPLDHDLRALQAEILGVANDTDRGNHPIDSQHLALAAGDVERHRHAIILLDRRTKLGAGQDAYALLLERAPGECGDLLVLRGQNTVEHFDDRHLRTHIGKEAGKLDADRA